MLKGGKPKGHVAFEGGFQKDHDWLRRGAGGQISQKYGHVVYGCPLGTPKIEDRRYFLRKSLTRLCNNFHFLTFYS